ncbi:ankyrin repeat domain-containing protein SOWAHA-like isoform X5 [Mauremys reevesii]|uniref:ankyrin repeat domain-containing protein SOWAHA-like isoform X5 n=1 Tax=Mauremys reevesii TaxID=260615 RepID=UPI00193F9070|nr:ankyrin repeat domain-containing protein SOWAHA-like isoform X5 [Mauremys reevesii]
MAPVQGVTLNPVLPPPPGSCQLASLGGALGGVPVWKSARGDRAVCDPSQASPPLQHSLQENPCSQGVLAAPFCPGEKLPAGRDVPGAVAALPGSGAWPGPPAGMALWEGPRAGPEEGPALPHILVTDFSASSTAAWGSLEGVTATALNPQPEPEPPGAAEEDAESVSKPESEQDASEDGGSSLGSSSVALDPVEKEWLQGAASGHLLTLSHLLKQEPSLATRKDFTSGFTALHWAAKHGQEDLASLLVAAGADVNSRSHVSTCLSLCLAAVQVGGAEGTRGCRGLARIPGGGGCAGRGPELRWDGAYCGGGWQPGSSMCLPCTGCMALHWQCGTGCAGHEGLTGSVILELCTNPVLSFPHPHPSRA